MPFSATGVVHFLEDGLVLGTAPVKGNGVATLTLTSLNAGSHAIVAAFPGDGNVGGSSSPAVSIDVSKRTAPDGGPALIFTVGNTSRLIGQGNPAPSPNISGVLVNGDTYATAVSGVPIYLTTAQAISPVGQYPIALTGLSAQNYTAAVIKGTLTVNKASPSITLASSLNPSPVGASITFTSSLSLGTTGTVRFLDGQTVLGTAVILNFVASFSTNALSVGTHSITTAYSGDTNFNSANSNTLSQAVNPAVDFAISSSTAAQIIPPGASASYAIKLTSVNGAFTNLVALTASNLPPNATFTFTPASVTPGASGANSSLTITVPQTVTAIRYPHNISKGFVLTYALLLMPLVFGRKSRSMPQRLFLWTLLILGSLGVIGCGTGGYFNRPEQSYVVTVTGTSGNLTHTTTVTLTVE